MEVIVMDVAIVQEFDLDYCRQPPFHPSSKYPEYPFCLLGPFNPVYEAVRTLYLRLNLDVENYNTNKWNPLGSLIKPGDNVLIKPNLVRHYNPIGDMNSQVTHGSVIRAVLDYVIIALKGEGMIVIGDAPVQSCNFGQVIEIVGLDKILDFYQKKSKVAIKLVDFRKYAGYPRKFGGIANRELFGDPTGYTVVNLGDYSDLADIQDRSKKFRVTNYDPKQMLSYHNTQDHCYLIANSVLQADVIINLPKLKTHRKAGMTCAMKNIVGIVGSKECLPHYRSGSHECGGDEYFYKDIRKTMITLLNESIDISKSQPLCIIEDALRLGISATQKIISSRDPYTEGSWYGNDTISRTIVDLNKIVMFVDNKGILKNRPQRKVFTICDAIVAGEKEGPLIASPKICRTLISGGNNVEVDLVCSRLMGFNYHRIPTLMRALNQKSLDIFSKRVDEIFLQGENKVQFDEIYERYGYDFVPASGWKGYIELDKFKEYNKF